MVSPKHKLIFLRKVFLIHTHTNHIFLYLRRIIYELYFTIVLSLTLTDIYFAPQKAELAFVPPSHLKVGDGKLLILDTEAEGHAVRVAGVVGGAATAIIDKEEIRGVESIRRPLPPRPRSTTITKSFNAI